MTCKKMTKGLASCFQKETILPMILSLTLFLGCAAFVIHRGYKCFAKYIQEPEAVDISYQFTGDVPFPSITICTSFWAG